MLSFFCVAPLRERKGILQRRKRNPNPNFLVRISSGGVLPREGVGAKKFSICPLKPRETKLFGGISLGARKVREKKVCAQFSSPNSIALKRVPRGSSEERHMLDLVLLCMGLLLASPPAPYSIQKRPEPQICQKFVPTIVLRGSN